MAGLFLVGHTIYTQLASNCRRLHPGRSAKLALLERADEDNAEAVNDLSEDMRKELDNIYQAIAALSIKVPQARKVGQPIGFKRTDGKK